MATEILSKRDERVKHFDLGNGQKQYVGFGAPVHYKNAQDEWDDIDLDFQDDGKGNLITDKNKVSCGFRKDKKLSKYFGLRYDIDHQFEATPTNIILDGVEQLGGTEFTTAATKETSQKVSNKLNANVEIVNRLSEVALRNYFKITNSIDDFKITEEIHLTGLTCSNKKDGDNYIPDEQGIFNFVDENGVWKFGIHPPFFNDADGKNYQTVQHELKLTNGKLFYTKTPTKEGKDDLVLAKFPIEVDADTFYTSTADGTVWNGNSVWATCQSAATGVSTVTNSAQDLISSQDATGKGNDFDINRYFAYFDTSTIGVGNTVTAAVFSLYATATAGGCTVSVQKGTQAATLTTADFDSFSGSYYATVTAASWAESAYNDFTFNATGKSDIVLDGTTKLCVRDYTYDYLNANPTPNTYNTYFYTAEEDTAGEARPKLVVTYTASAAATKLHYGMLMGVGS
jgi:hypothetical protein